MYRKFHFCAFKNHSHWISLDKLTLIGLFQRNCCFNCYKFKLLLIKAKTSSLVNTMCYNALNSFENLKFGLHSTGNTQD